MQISSSPDTVPPLDSLWSCWQLVLGEEMLGNNLHFASYKIAVITLLSGQVILVLSFVTLRTSGAMVIGKRSIHNNQHMA